MKQSYVNKETWTTADTSKLKPGVYVLNRIVTRREFHKQGGARKVMNEVLQEADKENATLILEINAYGPMNRRQLEAWYLRLGFTKIERSNLYIRTPKSNPK